MFSAPSHMSPNAGICRGRLDALILGVRVTLSERGERRPLARSARRHNAELGRLAAASNHAPRFLPSAALSISSAPATASSSLASATLLSAMRIRGFAIDAAATRSFSAEVRSPDDARTTAAAARTHGFARTSSSNCEIRSMSTGGARYGLVREPRRRSAFSQDEPVCLPRATDSTSKVGSSRAASHALCDDLISTASMWTSPPVDSSSNVITWPPTKPRTTLQWTVESQ